MRSDLPSGTVTFLFTDIERMLLLLDNFEQAMEELVEPALTDAWE